MTVLPNTKELEELKRFKEPFCLTMYIPLLEPQPSTNPNKIQLKKLLHEGEKALKDAGVNEKTIGKTTSKAHSLLMNQAFWPFQHLGLVLFMHPRLFRYYWVPDPDVPYMLTVERGFNLEPLLNVMENDKPYYVLALSHNDVRFFKGGHYGLKDLRLKNLPTNLVETLRIDEYPNETETHTVAPASRAAHSEAFHGQYNERETDKDMLYQFFRRIDQRLHTFLHNKRTPLIIASVDYLLPIYRRANTYPYLLPRGIGGNPQHMQLDDIRKQAWKILKRFSKIKESNIQKQGVMS